MKRRILRIRCWLRGHVPVYGMTGAIPCDRCGLPDIPYDELVGGPPPARAWRCICMLAAAAWCRLFPQRCPDCGSHDCDCLPF